MDQDADLSTQVESWLRHRVVVCPPWCDTGHVLDDFAAFGDFVLHARVLAEADAWCVELQASQSYGEPPEPAVLRARTEAGSVELYDADEATGLAEALARAARALRDAGRPS